MFISLVFSAGEVRGEKMTVKKVKGNSAVIETSAPLEEGRSYEISPEPLSQDVDYKSTTLKSRQNSFTAGTSFEYIKSDLLQSSSFSLQARYGWNYSSLEVGVLLEMSSVDQGGGATTGALGGGYFDYNLVSNRDPRQFIYGVFALVGTGSTQYPAGSTAGGSSSKLATNLGGFMTYFLGTSSTALRGEAFYNYQQINTTAQQNSVAGFGFRGLLVFYF